MNSCRLAVVMLILLGSSSPGLAQTRSAYLSRSGTGAVDVKGRRYRSESYPGRQSPWMLDRTKSVAPEYPYRERPLRHSGSGYFRLILDTKTGAVAQVIVQQSTGSATLDNCAIAAFRQWRWKPDRWKEI